MGLWYRCGTKGPLTYGIGGRDRVDTAYEAHRILSPPCSTTGTDTQGQGTTKPRFYRGLDTLEGTGRDRERHPVAVRLRSKLASSSGGKALGKATVPLLGLHHDR